MPKVSFCFISTKPFFAAGVQPGVTEDVRKTWNEPDPKSNAPTFYPFNHVHESECGHIHEIDDTPGGERLLQQHITGTFAEIHYRWITNVVTQKRVHRQGFN